MTYKEYKNFLPIFEEYKKMAVETAIECCYRNQSEAAEKAGISKSLISKLLSGANHITNKVASKILGRDIEEDDITKSRDQLRLEFLEAKQARIQKEIESLKKEMKGEENNDEDRDVKGNVRQ